MRCLADTASSRIGCSTVSTTPRKRGAARHCPIRMSASVGVVILSTLPTNAVSLHCEYCPDLSNGCLHYSRVSCNGQCRSYHHLPAPISNACQIDQCVWRQPCSCAIGGQVFQPCYACHDTLLGAYTHAIVLHGAQFPCQSTSMQLPQNRFTHSRLLAPLALAMAATGGPSPMYLCRVTIAATALAHAQCPTPTPPASSR